MLFFIRPSEKAETKCGWKHYSVALGQAKAPRALLSTRLFSCRSTKIRNQARAALNPETGKKRSNSQGQSLNGYDKSRRVRCKRESCWPQRCRDEFVLISVADGEQRHVVHAWRGAGESPQVIEARRNDRGRAARALTGNQIREPIDAVLAVFSVRFREAVGIT